MRCTTLLGLNLLPLLCLSQLYDRKLASINSPTWNWGQRISSAEIISKKPQHERKTHLSKRPFFPFSDLGASAGPRPRHDGTTKSRIVDDTLPGMLLTDGLKEGFTTLDVLQKEGRNSPRNSFMIKENLGGLHPDEVYYIDDDLLIIKGGGFKTFNSYPEPNQQIDDEVFQFNSYDNRNKHPSQDDEYNGNIATILAPPIRSSKGARQPLNTSQYYPYSLFLPATILNSESRKHYAIQPSQSLLVAPQRRQFHFWNPPRFNLEAPFIRHQNTNIYPGPGYVTYEDDDFKESTKQSTEDERLPVLPLRKFNLNPSTAMWNRNPQNSIYKPPSSISNVRTRSSYQQWQRRPSKNTRYPKPNDPSTWISLRGDTAVNFRKPRPKINNDAELLPNFFRSNEIINPEKLRTPQNRYPQEPIIQLYPIGISIQRVKNPRL